MAKKLLPITFIVSFLLSQSIIHNPINNVQLGGSLTVEASIIGISSTEGVTFTFFFRSYGKKTYFFSKMKYMDGKYKFTIPESFVNNNAIEYYIVSEIENSGIYAYPEIDPEENPILVKSNKINTFQGTETSIQSSGLLKANYQILSPDNNSKLLSEDLMISLSYFKMEDIDPTYTKIFINDIDYTNKATVRYSHFVIIPNEIFPDGEYGIKVHFRSMSGLEYEPITWQFKIISEGTLEKQKFIISQGGSLSGNYTKSVNEDNLLNIGELSANYRLKLDWLKFRTKVSLSTLEDPEEQTRNRFSFDFKTSYFDIKLGDSYPTFSEYSIKGSRIRGANILFENNFLHLNILKGNLVRATEGLPDEAMSLTVNSTPYVNPASYWIDDTDTPGLVDGSWDGIEYEPIDYDCDIETGGDCQTIGEIVGTRENYTFEQGVIGINLELTAGKKFKWGLELLKVKDKISSVDPETPGSVVLLPEEMVRHLFSDIYMCDYDELTGECSKFICNYDVHDVVQAQAASTGTDDDSFGAFDVRNSLEGFNEDLWVSWSPETVDLGVYSGECFGTDIDEDATSNSNLFQDQWSIYVNYDDLQEVIDDFAENSDYSGQIFNDSYYFGYEYETLLEGWNGSKPKDNIVIVTDFLHTLDNGKLRINYGLGFTMLNQNIWNPSLTYENLDKLGATEEEFTDCNVDLSICEVDNEWVDSMGNDVYDEGEPFVDADNNNVWTDDEDGLFNGVEIPDFVNDLEDFEDIFQTGISQVPIIPIDIEDGIKFKDFLTLPSAALFFDVSHKYFGHRINWGFRQIGPEYNTLGNPYLQTNIREQYFSDRTYFLDNKLNVLFKWKRTEDGISITEDNGESNKYDLNLGFYPGANMPTYNIGIGIYNRDNGIDPLSDEVPIIDANNNGIVDSVQCTTENTALYQEILLTCEDLAIDGTWTEDDYFYEEVLSTQLYQPEKTRTSQYSLSVNAPFEYIFRHNISFNIYVSEKKDLIQEAVNKTINQYINQNNNDYYSPSSKSQSYNLGIMTTYNKRIESLLGLNYTYYSYGYEDHPYHPEYFQDQRIYITDIKLFYDTLSWFGEIQPAVNFTIGKGTSNNFKQVTLKVGSKVEIIENLNFSINFNSKFKFIDIDDEETEFYNDYAVYMHLKYKF